jgi:PAS domain S-box-containing protein
VELTDIRERAEERAAEAVGLAEDLHFAKEDADKASAMAKAGKNCIQSLMNTVTDAIIMADSKGCIETFNPAAQKLFGYDIEMVRGQNASMLLPLPHKAKHDGYIKHFVDGNPARIIGSIIEEVAVDKNGREFPIELTINPIYIDDDVAFIAVIRYITERKKADEKIRKLAMTDSLTGLANRNAFMRDFEQAIGLTRRHQNHLALLMLDLAKFKPVNDTYGHPVGDAVLIEVANQMREICRETDIIARLGGDEFAIIMTDLDDNEKLFRQP